MGEVWVCVRIFVELVAIDLNRRLSRIVRNLVEPLHRSNWTMECEDYDEHGKYYTSYGYYCYVTK